jgi:hypothetical protein
MGTMPTDPLRKDSTDLGVCVGCRLEYSRGLEQRDVATRLGWGTVRLCGTCSFLLAERGTRLIASRIAPGVAA